MQNPNEEVQRNSPYALGLVMTSLTGHYFANSVAMVVLYGQT